MGHYEYPESWEDLQQVPSARSELIEYVKECADWNNPNGEIKKMGTDPLIDFLFDVYNMDAGAQHLIGRLIFEDEVGPLEQFIRGLDSFMSECEKEDRSLDRLHEVVLPDHVVEAARFLYDKLSERGLPKWIDSTIPL